MQDENFESPEQKAQVAWEYVIVLSDELESAKRVIAEQKATIQHMQETQNALADANIRIAELYGDLEEAYEKLAESEEIKKLNLQLTELHQESLATNEELNQTIEIIKDQNSIIDSKNKKIVASLMYAKRIQQAILPLPELLSNVLGAANFFVLYLPKDIVSGDFYWVETCGDELIMAVADCTGHGIPGAFMSMIGNQLLHEIVVQRTITQPNTILLHLNTELRRVLRQDDTTNKDGMEMSIIASNKRTNQVRYAGAMNPLYYVQHDGQPSEKILEIKASKRPVGGHGVAVEKDYELHTLTLAYPTTFYLSTDGFQDQFGSTTNRKFMTRLFKELLLKNSTLPLVEQQEALSSAFYEWKGTHEQTDDVTVVGIYIDFSQ